MTSPGPTDYLLLFAKYPYYGTAKTRLAPQLGTDGATAFARAALVDTLHLYATLSTSHTLVWCFAADGRSQGDEDVEQLLAEQGLTDKWQAWRQPEGGGLGERLDNAVQRASQSASSKPSFATVIGADCVVLGPEHVKVSVTKAKEHGACIHPANDGGYVLLTVALEPRSESMLFKDIRWSCRDTAADQIRQLQQCYKTSPYIASTLPDIDEPVDLSIFSTQDEETQRCIETHYPRTLGVIKRLQEKG